MENLIFYQIPPGRPLASTGLGATPRERVRIGARGACDVNLTDAGTRPSRGCERVEGSRTRVTLIFSWKTLFPLLECQIFRPPRGQAGLAVVVTSQTDARAESDGGVGRAARGRRRVTDDDGVGPDRARERVRPPRPRVRPPRRRMGRLRRVQTPVRRRSLRARAVDTPRAARPPRPAVAPARRVRAPRGELVRVRFPSEQTQGGRDDDDGRNGNGNGNDDGDGAQQTSGAHAILARARGVLPRGRAASPRAAAVRDVRRRARARGLKLELEFEFEFDGDGDGDGDGRRGGVARRLARDARARGRESRGGAALAAARGVARARARRGYGRGRRTASGRRTAAGGGDRRRLAPRGRRGGGRSRGPPRRERPRHGGSAPTRRRRGVGARKRRRRRRGREPSSRGMRTVVLWNRDDSRDQPLGDRVRRRRPGARREARGVRADDARAVLGRVFHTSHWSPYDPVRAVHAVS